MKKAASNGQFRGFVSGLLTTTEDAIPMIDSDAIQKAINECGNGTTQAELIKWINNGCRLEQLLVNAFTVGEVFRHRAEKGDRRLWLSDNTQNWLIKPNLKKVIPIHTDLGKLIENRLPNNMNDTSIQTLAGHPGFIDVETFLLVMYLLIFQPELGKQVLGYALQKDKVYIFHVMVDGKQGAFVVDWDDGEWSFYDCTFDNGDDWGEGGLFLSFATV